MGIRIGGSGQGNWGRNGNDDDKEKGNVNNKDKVTSRGVQDGDDKKDDKKAGSRGKSNGLGARMRQGLSNVRERINARVGHGHGDGTRGRLGEAGQRASGPGRNGLFTGINLGRIRGWMGNVTGASKGSSGGRSTFFVPNPGGNGGTFSSRVPVPTSRSNPPGAGVTGSGGGLNAPRGILKQPGSSPSSGRRISFDEDRNTTHDVDPRGAEHRNPMDMNEDVQDVVYPSQVDDGELPQIVADVIQGVESSGGDVNGSPYMTYPEPGDGSMGSRYNILGSNLTLHTGMSPSSERMHHLVHGLIEWGQAQTQTAPYEIERLPPAEVNEIRRNLSDVLEVFPEVSAVGSFGSGVAVAADPSVDLAINRREFVRVSSSGPIRVNLGDPTFSGNSRNPTVMGMLSRLGHSLGLSRTISIFRPENEFPGSGIRRLFGGPENEITIRAAHLTQTQYRKLLTQAENVEAALRLIPFGGPGLRADIYLPDPGDRDGLPRIQLGGFDYVSFGSEVGNGIGGISQSDFDRSREANYEGISTLMRILQNNRGDR